MQGNGIIKVHETIMNKSFQGVLRKVEKQKIIANK